VESIIQTSINLNEPVIQMNQLSEHQKSNT